MSKIVVGNKENLACLMSDWLVNKFDRNQSELAREIAKKCGEDEETIRNNVGNWVSGRRFPRTKGRSQINQVRRSQGLPEFDFEGKSSQTVVELKSGIPALIEEHFQNPALEDNDYLPRASLERACQTAFGTSFLAAWREQSPRTLIEALLDALTVCHDEEKQLHLIRALAFIEAKFRRDFEDAGWKIRSIRASREAIESGRYEAKGAEI